MIKVGKYIYVQSCEVLYKQPTEMLSECVTNWALFYYVHSVVRVTVDMQYK